MNKPWNVLYRRPPRPRPQLASGRSLQARVIGIAFTDGSILFACQLIAVAELWWEEVMFNERCTEPSLDELFGDSAMRLLMRRDGVTESDIRALLHELKGARAVALGGNERGPGAAISAAYVPDRREMVVSSRAAKSSESRKTPSALYERRTKG
jgi:hypothetical protein